MNRLQNVHGSRIASILLCLPVSLYLTLVCLLLTHRAFPILFFLALTAAFYVLLRLASMWLPEIVSHENPPVSNPQFCFPVFLACFVVLALYFAAYYPGGLSSDTWYQWRQAHGAVSLTDWHPALHTLLIWLLSRIYDNPAFCVAVQLLFYAFAVEYAVRSLLRTCVPRSITALYAIYLILSPALTNLILFLWKDCAFSIAALFLSAQLLNIVFTDAEWLTRRANRFALALTLCLVSILRHNGPALSLPVIVWLFVSLPRHTRTVLPICLLFFLLFLGVKGPLYRAFDVQQENQGIGEMIGLPMSILANIFAENPECLDEDIVRFLEDVAPLSIYQEYNSVGDWNDIKWHVGSIYTDRPYSVPEVYSYAVRAFCTSPSLGAEALSYIWQMPMWPFSDAYWQISPYQVKSFGMKDLGIPILKRILNWICRMSSTPFFSWLFWLPGFWMMVLCICCAVFGPRRPRLALLLSSGLISYHLATSLFLSSSTDFRFYLIFQMAAPMALLSLLYGQRPSLD